MAVLSVFFWGHMVFLPVVTAGVYLAYLIVLGEFFCRTVLRLKASDGAAVHFLCGSLLVILVFCLMSAVGIGAIGYLQVFVVVSGIFLVFWRCVRHGKKKCEKNRLEMAGEITGKIAGKIAGDIAGGPGGRVRAEFGSWRSALRLS